MRSNLIASTTYCGFANFGNRFKGGRLAFPEISEDQAEIFLHRIARDVHVGGKRLGFCGLLHALPRGIAFPAMIKAANGISLDPTHRQLSSSVSASVAHDVWSSVSPRYS